MCHTIIFPKCVYHDCEEKTATLQKSRFKFGNFIILPTTIYITVQLKVLNTFLYYLYDTYKYIRRFSYFTMTFSSFLVYVCCKIFISDSISINSLLYFIVSFLIITSVCYSSFFCSLLLYSCSSYLSLFLHIIHISY